MGGNKDDVGGWGVEELMCMFCGRNLGRGEEQWDTKWCQNNHFSLGWLERKCKNVLLGFVTPGMMHLKQKIRVSGEYFAV